MNNPELAIGARGQLRGKIIFIIPVRNQVDGGGSHGGEVGLYAGSHRDNGRSLVQHGLFQLELSATYPRHQRQVLIVEHTGPRIPEIRHPWRTKSALQATPNQMHRLRRAGRNYHIYRMFAQICRKIFHRRANPSGTRIGHKEIATHPQHKFLLPTLLLGVYRVHSRPFSGTAAYQLMVNGIRLAYGLLQHLDLRWNLSQKALIHSKLLRIGRGIYNGLPAERGQIFGELHPSLHP